MTVLTQVAASETTNGGIFGALGVDWKMLIFQIIAFLILMWFLGKFVYPWLIKSVDERAKAIEDGVKAAADAQAAALDAENRVTELLKEARTEARDIIATAKIEATNALTAAEERAKKRADQIVTEAHAEIEKDIRQAKITLHNETLSLVTLATEKVLGKAASKDIDSKLITATLKELK